MGVRFAPDVRRLIVASTMLAEARHANRPRVRDLTDALAHQRETIPPVPIAALEDDLESVLGPASQMAAGEEVTLGMVIKALSLLGQKLKSGSRAPDASAVPLPGTRYPIPAHHPRVGIGYDSHRFATGGPMRLGGIDITSDVHCAGHSDGDAICHALADAILGAANAGDIGEMFPDTDPANKGRDSLEMLRAAVARVKDSGLGVHNADVTVISEQPKLAPHREAIARALAGALGVDASMISVKGKTNEGMGAIGRGEGLAVMAVATLAPVSR